MIDVEQVKERLLVLTSLSADRLNELKWLIDDGIEQVESMLKHEDSHTQPKVIGLAAVFCANQLALLEGEGELASFTAGDIHIATTQGTGGLKELLRVYLEGAKEFLQDDSFQFQVI